MTRTERNLMWRTAIWGVALTLFVIVLDQTDSIVALERWLYDRRARDCQFFTPPPTDQLVHLDIDDRALQAIKPSWPWPRSHMAGIIDELRRAGAKVVALDVIFPEPQKPEWVRRPDGTFDQIDHDAVLAEALRRHGRVLLAINPDVPPIPLLRGAAASVGLVKHLRSPDGVLRSVPLLYEKGGERLTQLALALGAMYLDADPRSLSVRDNRIIVAGAQVRREIPVQNTTRAARDTGLSAFFNVPWFGKAGEMTEWETMYDWPDHAEKQQHISIVEPWQIAKWRRVRRDDAPEADRALTDLLQLIAPTRVGEVPRTPGPDPKRHELIKDALKQAQFYLDGFAGVTDLTEPEQQQLQLITAATAAIRKYDANAERIERHSRQMTEMFEGKAVLIGWIATGAAVDDVPTSLHAKCPGVVVHGTIFNAVMTGEFWRQAPPWVTVMVTLGFGLLMTLAVTVVGPVRALGSAVVLIVSYVLLNGIVLFDYYNVIVGAAGPMVAVAVVWSVCTVVRFVSERAERRRITRRFQHYVDPALVHYVLEHPEQAHLDGQVRELTVVFTDLAGFTALSERLREKTVPMLNEYMELMVPIIRGHDGYVNKFLGDGIMFFFGAPKQSAAHAADAIATVLEMQEVLRQFNVKLIDRGLPPVAMRAGVSTGQMVVGDAGSTDASDYTVLGDTVNLGARLESANKATGTRTLVTQRTVELVGDRLFLYRPVGRLLVVGKTEPEMTYEPLAFAERATDDDRHLAELTAAMVEPFPKGHFKVCLEAIDQLEQAFGPGKLTALYRELCQQYLECPPQDGFVGQIVLTEK